MIEKLLQQQQAHLQHFFSSINVAKTEEMIELLLQCRGSIIFAGIGKSGIIAKNIVATLISIGIRSNYLSVNNALHGDIGIVSKEDIIVLLSKSGSTQELVDLIVALRKKQARIMAWVSNADSKLANLCDFFMYLPLQRELCPFDLTPTTSPVLQLLFGTIVTVALMQKKQFNLNKYKLNHPQGVIGKKMFLRVKDLMLQKENVPICFVYSTIGEALIELLNKRCNSLLIIGEDGRLYGIFTNAQLQEMIANGHTAILKDTVASLAMRTCRSLKPDMLAINAFSTMKDFLVKEIPVTEGDKVIGLLRLSDLIAAGITTQDIIEVP